MFPFPSYPTIQCWPSLQNILEWMCSLEIVCLLKLEEVVLLLPYERILSKMAAHKIPCIFHKTKIFYSSCLLKITLCEIVLPYSLSFPSNQCMDSEVHAYSTVKTLQVICNQNLPPLWELPFKHGRQQNSCHFA